MVEKEESYSLRVRKYMISEFDCKKWQVDF